LGKSFLTIWLSSPEYVQWSYPALVILASVLGLAMAQSAASRILYGTGELRVFSRLTMLEALVNILLSLWLIHSLELIGIAWSATIASTICSIAVISLVCRKLELSFLTYFGRSWTKPLIANIGLVGIWSLVDFPIQTWLDFGRMLLIGLIPYTLGVLLLERKRFSRRQKTTPEVAVVELKQVEIENRLGIRT
jgi:Na+-driven multidrug efflux pump